MKKKYIYTIAILMVIVVVAGTMLIIFPRFSFCRSVSNSGYNESLYEGIFDLNNLSSPRIYLTAEASKIISIEQIKKMGLEPVLFNTLFDIQQIPESSMLIIHVNDLWSANKDKPGSALEQLDRLLINTKKFVIMILNPDRDAEKGYLATGIIAKIFAKKNIRLVLPIQPPDIPVVKKEGRVVVPVVPLDKRLFTAEALVYSTDPNGLIVVEKLVDVPQIILLSIKWGGLSQKLRIDRVLGSSSITSQEDATFIGYVGWYTASFDDSVPVGTSYVKVEYYQPKKFNYNAVFAHLTHAAKGYRTTCCWWIFCWPKDHYPSEFITSTDWNTSVYPGQVLANWEPKNVGSASTINYTIAWGATISVRYSIPITTPPTPYYIWYDMTDPAAGIAKTKHVLRLPQNYDTSRLNGVAFTVEPISVGFLDPNKPGGVPPFEISHEFLTTFNTGHKIHIVIHVYLYV